MDGLIARFAGDLPCGAFVPCAGHGDTGSGGGGDGDLRVPGGFDGAPGGFLGLLYALRARPGYRGATRHIGPGAASRDHEPCRPTLPGPSYG